MKESGDGPLMDGMAQAVKKMIARGKERGYVTYDEMNAALPPEQSSSEQIEDTMAMLSEMGINVVESEEQDDNQNAAAESDGETSVSGNMDDDDIGRTDDPVRMYLREMGSVELLSREGEIAIAKRIEAGREMMIGGICESPLTIRAIIDWHDALNEGKMLLRDIIDLDATYGGGPEGEVAEGIPVAVEGEAGAEQARRAEGRRPRARKAKSLPSAPSRRRWRRRWRGEQPLAFRHGSGTEAAGPRNLREDRGDLQEAAQGPGIAA